MTDADRLAQIERFLRAEMSPFCKGSKDRHQFETRCLYCGRSITDSDVTFVRQRERA